MVESEFPLNQLKLKYVTLPLCSFSSRWLTNCSTCNASYTILLNCCISSQWTSWQFHLKLTFLFPFFFDTWLIRPLQVGIWEKFSQFYFNWRWQHVVSDEKHIFFRDYNHQLGSYFLAPPSSWTYLEKETAACGLLNARELNLKKEREKVTQENNFKIHLESFCVYVCSCVYVHAHVQRLTSITQFRY